MMEELKQHISKWMEESDHIILVIDLNLHILDSEEAESLCNIGLHEVIADKHQEESSVPTHQSGAVPIDGIFASGSITISSGGHLPFGEVCSDHRALWVKVKISNAFGHTLHKTPLFISRRVKCNNPRFLERFN